MLKFPFAQNKLLASSLLVSSLLSVAVAAGVGFALPHLYRQRSEPNHSRKAPALAGTASSQGLGDSVVGAEENYRDPVTATETKRQPRNPRALKPAHTELVPSGFVEDFPTAIPGL